MADNAVGDDVAEQGGDRIAIGAFPQAQQVGAAELAAELLANPRAGKPEAVTERARAFDNEGLRQHRCDHRWLDLEAARRNAAIAYVIPIRVKLPTRWLLHNPPDAKRHIPLTGKPDP